MKNIVLTIRTSPTSARRVINRMYGSGDISRDRYIWHMRRIASQEREIKAKRADKVNILLENPRCFYNKKSAR